MNRRLLTKPVFISCRKTPSLSLFVHMMRGEYDDILLWPFTGTVTLSIMNVTRTIRALPIRSLKIHFKECGVTMGILNNYRKNTFRQNND